MSKRVFLKNGNIVWDNLEIEDLTVTGTSTTKTDETLEGDTTIGDASTDDLTINATLASNFALGGFSLTDGGDVQADTFSIINAGAGANPILDSNDAAQRITLTGGLIVNEGGADVDTRIEGSTSTYLLFADAGNNRVAIVESGSLSPDTLLHVHSASAGTVAASGSAVSTVEGTGTVTYQVLTDDAGSGGLLVGHPTGGPDVGQLLFFGPTHATSPNEMRVRIGDALRLAYSAGAFDFQEATTVSTTTGDLTLNPFNSLVVNAADFSGTPSTAGSLGEIQAQTFTDNATAASGTAASHVFTSLAAPTLAASNTGVTTTDAATLYVAGAPTAGTNQTITNPWALWVDAGDARFDANIRANGTLSLDDGTTTISSAELNLLDGRTSIPDVTGTPANNQLATFTDADTLQGEANLLFDGSTLTISAGLVHDVSSISGATTLTGAEHTVLVDSSAATVTVTLEAAPTTGQTYTIRRDGANTVTVDGNGNNIQEGTSSAATFDLASDAQRVTLTFDGTVWKGVD